jgi:hypothetical protein
LVHDGAPIPKLELGAVVKLSDAKREFVPLSEAAPAMVSGDLKLTLELDDAFVEPPADAIRVELKDGSKISAKFGTVDRKTINLTSFGQPKAVLELRLREWLWESTEAPIAWVGILHGPDARLQRSLPPKIT